ncbi:MAG: flavin reductase family protein [Anaerolineales bacterium]
MEVDSAELSWQTAYKLLTGAVVPRPIGWISTVDADGNANLAPFSFFNVVCANPPTVLFSTMRRGAYAGRKDTLNNARATGEFVVNIVSGALVEAMNFSSADVPPDVDEFTLAGVSKAASVRVVPPRVAESPIHFECKVLHIYDVSDAPGGGSVVIGEVLHLHVDESVLLGADKIDPDALQAVGRMAGNEYTRTRERFTLARPVTD